MTVKRGKSHVFVGMNFELTDDHKVKIRMDDYISECIDAFQDVDEELTRKAATPAKHNLFDVDDSEIPLDDIRADVFHHIVGKLLYVSKRARINIDLAVSFLCMRVAKSNQQDWMKLKRLLTYLRNTLGLPRVIGAHRLDILFTWVDASFATHMDMRGHTGGVISFGTGVVSHKSAKQKINTKSSTETEVVGASEYLPWTLWTQRFMAKQRYPI